uniref:Si603031f07b n=1 Tax=Arundo donax TaxID=35708 RepID=A0A0A9EYN1_ARUDO
MPVCSPALWHPPCRISLCTNSSSLATLHERNRLVQHHPLEP